ncbi:MAG: DUF883 domain-containing protein [Verrucomicrobiales bacterium]|nr:DUF883 domain-containing protein [Verrucomicrobiales bacterium]
MNTRYETPEALQHDARTLADDARALLAATSNIADEKVTAARQRLETALERGRDLLNRGQDQARMQMQAADQCVRRNPYQTIGMAFGLGAVLGYLFNRR